MKTLTENELSTLIGDLSLTKNQKVEIQWNEELQKWVPKIIEIVTDVNSGNIKSTWKTHLAWVLVTLVTFLSTYLLTPKTEIVEINSQLDIHKTVETDSLIIE